MKILPNCKGSENGKHKFAEIKPKYLKKRMSEIWEQCQNKDCRFLLNRKVYGRVKKKRVNKN